jgi:hypothetical protein
MTPRLLTALHLPAALTVVIVVLAYTRPAAGQTPTPDLPIPKPAPVEIELNLINLPTTLSMDRHRSYFRLTHRFARDLRRGDFASLAEDLFSLDNGAIIGLDYRFAITGNMHVGVNRSILSKTIQMFARYEPWRQSDGRPFSVSVLGSIEGLNNMRQQYQPGGAVTLSRVMGTGLALYVTPAFVGRTRVADFIDGHDHEHDIPGAEEDEHSDHRHTAFIGLGARVRVLPSAYVVGEYSPRVAGHDPGNAVWGVGIERKTRGHTLQMNVTNSFGTTLGQVARGGSDHDIYLGFNVTRKF